MNNTFTCPKCNHIQENCNCGMKLCPKCNTEMITVNNKHDKIKGFCGKCNHAIYLANINKKIIYKCAKLNKQIDEVLSNCIAI